MKFIKYLFFLVLFVMTGESSSARDVGCRLSNNNIYTKQIAPGLVSILFGSTPAYENSPIVTTPLACTTPIQPCKVCLGQPVYNLLGILITGCNGPGWADGTQINFVLNCDLDSNNLILLLFSTITGSFFIYKSNRTKYQALKLFSNFN